MQQVWGGSEALLQPHTERGPRGGPEATHQHQSGLSHKPFSEGPAAPPGSRSIYNTSVFKQEALKDAVTGQGCWVWKFTSEERMFARGDSNSPARAPPAGHKDHPRSGTCHWVRLPPERSVHGCADEWAMANMLMRQPWEDRPRGGVGLSASPAAVPCSPPGTHPDIPRSSGHLPEQSHVRGWVLDFAPPL